DEDEPGPVQDHQIEFSQRTRVVAGHNAVAQALQEPPRRPLRATAKPPPPPRFCRRRGGHEHIRCRATYKPEAQAKGFASRGPSLALQACVASFTPVWHPCTDLPTDLATLPTETGPGKVVDFERLSL